MNAYRFAKTNNGRLMTSMGNWKTLYTSGFTAFKTYLNGRLWFNVNYEYSDLEKTSSTIIMAKVANI